jgi:hypothetical protein
MANILPLDAQKQVAAMRRSRLLIVLSIAICALALLMALALVPSYLALRSAVPSAADRAREAREITDPQALARAQQLVERLSVVLVASTSPTALIAAALLDRPSGTSVNHIHYGAAGTEKPAEMILTGSATRDRIAAYRDALSRNPLFTGVSVPVSALVGASGDFSVTFVARDTRSAF